MSLETINKKLIKIEKETSFKKLFLLSLIVAIGSIGIIFLNDPNYLSHYEQPLTKVMILSMLIMGFMTIPMVFLGGTIASGIMLTWFLIKCRDQFYYTNAAITGKSLSFNGDFLNYLTDNLFPRLTGFIKSHNDPRFFESDLRVGRLENTMEKITEELKDWKKLTSDLSKRFSITSFSLKWENVGLKERVSKLEKENTNLQTRIKSLEDWKSEQEQKISKNVHAQNNTENTKSLDGSTKIEFLDE